MPCGLARLCSTAELPTLAMPAEQIKLNMVLDSGNGQAQGGRAIPDKSSFFSIFSENLTVFPKQTSCAE